MRELSRAAFVPPLEKLLELFAELSARQRTEALLRLLQHVCRAAARTEDSQQSRRPSGRPAPASPSAPTMRPHSLDMAGLRAAAALVVAARPAPRDAPPAAAGPRRRGAHQPARRAAPARAPDAGGALAGGGDALRGPRAPGTRPVAARRRRARPPAARALWTASSAARRAASAGSRACAPCLVGAARRRWRSARA